MQPIVIDASEYGILPDTGKDTAEKLRAVIEQAKRHPAAEIVLKAGTYILEKPEHNIMLPFEGCENLTLRGAVDTDGAPATWLKIRMPLQNDAPGWGFIAVRRSENIAFENLIFDYAERFSSAGEVAAVDAENDRVVVDVFEGQSHFDGMKCYSANSWNLKSKELNPVPALTIGFDQQVFSHTWHRVDHTERRYAIQGIGMSRLVKPGDGVSWHFNVIGRGEDRPNVFLVSNSENFRMENLRIYSCMGMIAIFVANRNITMRDVRVEPEGSSLAVCPRDFAWLVATSGKLLVERVYVKGVRWDPFNVHAGIYPITEMEADRKSIHVEMEKKYQRFCGEQRTVFFWTPDGAKNVPMTEIEETETGFWMRFANALPEEVAVGGYVTPGWMVLEEAVFRDVTIEGNCGTGLLFQNMNLMVEDCVFRNNTYDDIALGPIVSKEGCFVQNAVIRNSFFEASTWMNKCGTHEGAISMINAFEPLAAAPYNRNISITQNRFRNYKTAICVRNAEKIALSENRMENVQTEVLIESPKKHEVEN